MVLDHECFRAILLYRERNCYYDTQSEKQMDISFYKICNAEELKIYSNDNKHYIVSKLFEGGYVNGYVIPKNNFETFRRANITSLTLKGQDMVDNISNDTIWNGVKDKIKSGGRVSISILSQIVGETAAAYSKKMMGIE